MWIKSWAFPITEPTLRYLPFMASSQWLGTPATIKFVFQGNAIPQGMGIVAARIGPRVAWCPVRFEP